jgi:hypothetical protein
MSHCTYSHMYAHAANCGQNVDRNCGCAAGSGWVELSPVKDSS